MLLWCMYPYFVPFFASSLSTYYIQAQVADRRPSVLFFATLCSTIIWIFQNRRASSRSTTTAPPTGPAAHEEAGVQQVPTEMKQDASYPHNNGNLQMQQGGYGPVSPQEQYPPQGQYPTQQYPPQQQYPQQGYPPQQHRQPMGYYGGPEGQQQPMQQQQQGQQIPNYPTPTPEMQSERREM